MLDEVFAEADDHQLEDFQTRMDVLDEVAQGEVDDATVPDQEAFDLLHEMLGVDTSRNNNKPSRAAQRNLHRELEPGLAALASFYNTFYARKVGDQFHTTTNKEDASVREQNPYCKHRVLESIPRDCFKKGPTRHTGRKQASNKVVGRSFRDYMRFRIFELKEKIRNHEEQYGKKHLFFFVGFRLDEAQMKVRFSDEDTKSRIGWLLAKFKHMEELFNEYEREQIRDAISSHTSGSAKILNITTRIKWGYGDHEGSLVPTRGACIESTNHAAIMNALRICQPDFNIEQLLTTVAPFVAMLLISFGGDRAGGVQRTAGELAQRLAPYCNVLFLVIYCMIHSPHDRVSELLKAMKVSSWIYSQNALLGNSYYRAEWLTSQCAAAGLVCKNAVKAIDPSISRDFREKSNAWLLRVFALTTFRKVNVKAKWFPGRTPRPFVLDDTERQIFDDCLAFMDVWTINPNNFQNVLILAKPDVSDSQRRLDANLTYSHCTRWVLPVGDVAES